MSKKNKSKSIGQNVVDNAKSSVDKSDVKSEEADKMKSEVDKSEDKKIDMLKSDVSGEAVVPVVSPKSDSNNDPKERGQGVMGTEVPVSSPLNNMPEPSVVQTNVVVEAKPAVNQSLAVITGDSTNVTLTMERLDMHVRLLSSVPTVLSANKTPLSDEFYLTYKQSYALGSFLTPDQFMVETVTLALRLIEERRGIMYDVKKEANPYLPLANRIPVQGTVGENFKEWMEVKPMMRDDIRLQNMPVWQRISDLTVHEFGPGNERLDEYERIPMYNHPDELKLQAFFHQHENNDELIDPIVKWRFFDNLGSTEYFLKRLPPGLDQRFARCFAYYPTQAFNFVMDRSKEIRMSMCDGVIGMIRSDVTIRLKRETEILAQALNELQVSTTTHSIVNDYPRMMSSESARSTLTHLMAAIINSRWMRLTYTVHHELFDFATLLNCIAIKIVMPKACLEPTSVIHIDNYLARHLIPNLHNFNGIVPTASDCRRGDVNYLVNFLDQENPVCTNVDDLRDFLYTTDAGSGWNTVGMNEAVLPDNLNDVQFMNRNFLFYPFGGTMGEDMDESWPQFERYGLFVDAMLRARPGGQRNAGLFMIGRNMQQRVVEGIKAYLAKLADRSSRMFVMRYQMNLILKKLALLSIVYPANSLDDYQFNNDRNLPIPYEIEGNGIMSMIELTDWESMGSIMVGKEFIETGWVANRYFTKLCSTFQFVMDYYRYPINHNVRFTLTERVEILFKLLTDKFSLAPLLERKFKVKPLQYDLMRTAMPTVEQMDLRQDHQHLYLTTVINFIHDHPKMFGYANHFYFNPACRNLIPIDNAALRLFSSAWVYSADQDPDVIMTYAETVESLHMETFNPMLNNARTNSLVIRFDFAVGTKLEWITNQTDFNHCPLNYDLANNKVQISTVNSYLEWDRIYRNRAANAYSGQRPPEWQLDTIPEFINDENFNTLQDLLQENIQMRKEGLSIFDDWQFVRKFG